MKQVREILKIDNFDPMEIDISRITAVSDQIPQEGYIDPSMAERLATVCLQAADFCVDLLAQATLYLSHCDAKRRTAKAHAINRGISRKVPSTIVKETAACDEEYIESMNNYNLALAWHTWLETKRDTLIKTHHLCKDLVRKTESTSTNWTPSNEVELPRASKASFMEESTKNTKSTSKVTGPVSWT